MRIRLERQHPILRVQQHPEEDDHERPDLAVVTLIGPSVEVVGSWTIAVELEHDGATHDYLRELALGTMKRMIEMYEPTEPPAGPLKLDGVELGLGNVGSGP